MNVIKSIALLCAAITLGACDKNAVQDITAPQNGARVKFFNFAMGAPGVNFYANDRKLTAIGATTTTESTVGTSYGGVAAGGLYTQITPGAYEFSGRITAATDKGLAVAKMNSTVEDGKMYSFYMAGPYNTATKSADFFMVEDALPATVDYTKGTVRFVNAIYNSQPLILYARNTETNVETAIGGAVAFKSAGAFTALAPGSYDLSARVAGTTTNRFTRAAVTFAEGRVYTITARGDITITSTTAINRPFLDNTLNY